jgi:hypothetical protein
LHPTVRYLVECKVDRVERAKKVWLSTKIEDGDGTQMVDGESLYIITGIKQKVV